MGTRSVLPPLVPGLWRRTSLTAARGASLRSWIWLTAARGVRTFPRSESFLRWRTCWPSLPRSGSPPFLQQVEHRLHGPDWVWAVAAQLHGFEREPGQDSARHVVLGCSDVLRDGLG